MGRWVAAAAAMEVTLAFSGQALAQEPAEGVAADESAGAAAPTAEGVALPADESFGVVSLNAGGFGFFGPALSAELGGKVSGHAGVRLFALGALSHVLFVEDDESIQMSSLGASLGARYYFGERKFQGFYAGAAAELLLLGFENERSQLEVTRRVLVPAVEGGYRIRFGSLLLGFGARAGYSFELSNGCEPLGGAKLQCVALDYGDTFYGEGVLDVGFVF